MPVYLSIGRTSDGEFRNVKDQVSGLTDLQCPFCKCGLIAVKGPIKSHHFRHDGETCNESLTEIPTISGWHHFHLNFPLSVVQALHEGFNPKSKSPNVFKKSLSTIEPKYREPLFSYDEWADNYLFSDSARIILGSMTLSKFSIWMRGNLQSRITELKTRVGNGEVHEALFDIEANRQQVIMASTLYLFEFHLSDGSEVLKIGRTRRSPETRLVETVRDIERETQCKVTKTVVLRQISNCGYIEQYALHRYKEFKLEFGSHQEYLKLDKASLRKLKSDFTRLNNSLEPFNLAERFILTGRWRYEKKRLNAIRRGIALTLNESGTFGRPKGSTEDLVSKHPDIIEALNEGLSINQVVRRSGKSQSTVKRVKRKMKQ
ncbi:hypothetical protein A1QO_04090 [Vibrio genomosp. F10 str. ZF-129]|uniref:Bacteriophage T5 Orf172 DNA-binding domain-containing protein n=1 Tax=Vibrio genomosp. F10 str. ZF-129 TaxID=1187848 RepID=A0A1E5BJ03_9VIBR|nr:GIY-YIG nuclease family protein [Vibrio genomosp. F10]OEE37292.1 hypothetical protein A1QO_04090 [Vibrio genomosp. F10 str. ZF-129]